MKRKLKYLFPVLIAAVLCMLTVPVGALDDDEFGGYSADTLTIKVGYFGGPYYEKAVFSLQDLWAMDVVYADYTLIDNMPSVVIDHVAGVRLADIMDAAGIDLNSIETFYFWTNDKTSSYYTSYPKTELIDTPRYVYYSLPDNFDSEEGCGNDYSMQDYDRVDTVIALADDWNRVIAGASFGSDYMNLNTNTRFRLMFGQTNSWEHTASRSAKWIHEIVVELGGTPTITLDASALEGEVGSILRTEASVSADSAVMANEAVTWSSSDDSIASVDENGNITVLGEGSAVITATFAGVSASVTINGGPGEGSGTATTETDGGSSGASTNVVPATDEHRTTPSPEATSDSSAETAGAHEIQPAQTETAAQDGGVQNWRVFEMSETATALPVIEEDNPLLGFTGVSAACLFVGGGAGYVILFYTDIRRKKDVYRRKPE